MRFPILDDSATELDCVVVTSRDLPREYFARFVVEGHNVTDLGRALVLGRLLQRFQKCAVRGVLVCQSIHLFRQVTRLSLDRLILGNHIERVKLLLQSMQLRLGQCDLRTEGCEGSSEASPRTPASGFLQHFDRSLLLAEILESQRHRPIESKKIADGNLLIPKRLFG